MCEDFRSLLIHGKRLCVRIPSSIRCQHGEHLSKSDPDSWPGAVEGMRPPSTRAPKPCVLFILRWPGSLLVSVHSRPDAAKATASGSKPATNLLVLLFHSRRGASGVTSWPFLPDGIEGKRAVIETKTKQSVNYNLNRTESSSFKRSSFPPKLVTLGQRFLSNPACQKSKQTQIWLRPPYPKVQTVPVKVIPGEQLCMFWLGLWFASLPVVTA